jgi:hypothetical protein
MTEASWQSIIAAIAAQKLADQAQAEVAAALARLTDEERADYARISSIGNGGVQPAKRKRGRPQGSKSHAPAAEPSRSIDPEAQP